MCDGFAIELKTPKCYGKLNKKQADYLEQLEGIRYKALISNKYDNIVIELPIYYVDLTFPCTCSSKIFRAKATLHGLLNCLHTKMT